MVHWTWRLGNSFTKNWNAFVSGLPISLIFLFLFFHNIGSNLVKPLYNHVLPDNLITHDTTAHLSFFIRYVRIHMKNSFNIVKIVDRLPILEKIVWWMMVKIYYKESKLAREFLWSFDLDSFALKIRIRIYF